jgi:hypothetical protein
MGVKGGCSPQNNLQNLGSYYPSLEDAATKISINYADFLRGRWQITPGDEDVDLERPLVGHLFREVSPNTCGIVRCAF